MAKARLKRYQSLGNQYPRLPLTGRVLLKYVDDGEGSASPAPNPPVQPGDARFYLHCDMSGSGRTRGDYEGLGVAGYLKMEVHDGKEWRLVRMDDFFPDRIHHFSKKERPVDTYFLCAERIREQQGTKLMRTYREHYALEGSSED